MPKSIRSKLTFLIVLNSSVALLLAGVALFVYESYQQRGLAARELSVQAAMIAENSTAALSFSDESAAVQILSAFRADSQVIEAVIYDSSGRLFASYSPAGQESMKKAARAPVGARRAGAYFADGCLLVFQPIQLRGERIGTIFLKSNMSEMDAHLRNEFVAVSVVLMVSLMAALLLSSRVQRTMSKPIGELSELARRVSLEKNYSLRAVRRTNDEVGFLVESFNEMLSQIENREDARKIAETSLRESEERYALAARGANDGLWDWKLASSEIYFSSRWKQMLGYTDDEIWPDPECWFDLIHASDRSRVKSQISAHIEGLTPEFAGEYRMRHRNGTFVWVLSRGIAVRDEKGVAIRMAGSQTDITEGKVGDPLTGLPNRLFLIDKLESSFEGARQQNARFAILYLDLDRFKAVNDSLGHAAGDELLMEVAGRLRSAVYGADHSGIVTRLGGDEFAVLLNDVQSEEVVASVADRILKKLSVPFHIGSRQVFAGVSIGIAMSPSASSPEDLLRNADTAMYHAKTMGKARVEIFDESMRERASARMEVETGLRKAIQAGELVVYYQPEVSISSRRVIGYEALVRWNHPARGLLNPGEFIPIAEESDLIIEVGRCVLREACRQMVEWQRSFPADPPLRVSVNVSARQIGDAEFIGDVERILAETGLDPKCLRLELTESSIMKNPETGLNTLRRLKLLDVGLEIDDFGTGYSSLSYLQKLPFDTLKIDRSFVKEMGTDVETSEIVRTILELARSLNMDVVAEGVETRDQLQRLTKLGCDYVQGFYFAKPASPGVTRALMEETSMLRASFRALEAADENHDDSDMDTAVEVRAPDLECEKTEVPV